MLGGQSTWRSHLEDGCKDGHRKEDPSVSRRRLMKQNWPKASQNQTPRKLHLLKLQKHQTTQQPEQEVKPSSTASPISTVPQKKNCSQPLQACGNASVFASNGSPSAPFAPTPTTKSAPLSAGSFWAMSSGSLSAPPPSSRSQSGL